MSLYGNELLLKIFRKWEADPDGCTPVTIPITRSSALPYFQAESMDDKDLLHAYLKRAEREGCIELTWGRLNTAQLPTGAAKVALRGRKQKKPAPLRTGHVNSCCLVDVFVR